MISSKTDWAFLTNQARVCVFIAKHPDATIRHIAQKTNLTERTVQNILVQLETSGCMSRKKVGRRNFYTVDPLAPIGHKTNLKHTVGDVLRIFESDPPTKESYVDG